MKKLVLVFWIFFQPLLGKEVDIHALSKSLGHMISKQLETTGVELDMQQVVKGMEEAKQGKKPPLPFEACIKELLLLQEKAHKQLAEANLQTANAFLEKNSKKTHIKQLIAQKLQYETLKKGNGNIVQDIHSPLVIFQGKTLSNKTFSSPSQGEVLHFQEIIEGLKLSVIGMKEGEKRRIFIHPDLGYGENSREFPNELIIFELEVLKANSYSSSITQELADQPTYR